MLINVYTIKGRGFSLSSDDIQLTSDTFEAAKAMFAAAKAEGMEGFILTSGYRSYQQQQTVYDAQPTVAVKPGTSEHGSGLAFDVTAYGNDDFTRTAQYKWLYEHCWDYGFILRYPADKTQITGCPAESWHYRYVGLPHSRLMGELGMCLEEYIAYVQAQGVIEVTLDGQVYRVEGAPGQPVRSFKVSEQ
jgi:D-alanyl-D-alanine carboxypeptidase